MPTPSQVDILVSDDSLAFCPTMYYRVFTLVETRAKSKLRVRLAPFKNMLKLSSFSFYRRRFIRSSFKMLKTWPLSRTVVCVCVGGGGGGGGGGGVKTL